ncbi:hypothetical protein ACSBOB_14725 [Mesorhizobium sp. ASY16-5R]|uniref:hypothetical protein n=1 Tax=Mesorhizobium sp. ASY16-5R TaxID=3445772 RepID=UPI003FA11AC9
MDLKDILGFLRKPKPKLAELRDRAAALPSEIDTAERAADALERRRRDMLLTATDAELSTIDADIAAANRGIERLFAVKDALAEKLAAAEAEDAETQRKRKYEAALAAHAEGLTALRDYVPAAQTIIDVIRRIAAAERIIAAANSDLPTGSAKIESPEQTARGIPGTSTIELSRKPQAWAWHYAGTNEQWGFVDEGLLATCPVQEENGRHYIETRVHSNYTQLNKYLVEKRRRIEIRTQLGLSPHLPIPLAGSVTLPGFAPGADDLWRPVGSIGGLYGELGSGADTVLAQVEALAEASRRRPKDPRGELVVNVTHEIEARNSGAVE